MHEWVGTHGICITVAGSHARATLNDECIRA